ncbi:hypothetical protein [Treponema parvum]|uniref:hypothetical protein n=1 Tax=Treponema parvum TaxID=138851 RepID=UPI001AEBC9F5|nr:hypothetical protein [Treponema parvum]
MEENMDWNEIDSLPGKINVGLLDYENAVWKLLTDVYKNPHRFTGRYLDEDTKSDFVINIQPKIKKLIARYNPDTCPFSAYFTNYVSNAFYSWQRSRIKESYGMEVLDSSSIQLYEDSCIKYAEQEYSGLYEAASPMQTYSAGRVQNTAEVLRNKYNPNKIDESFFSKRIKMQAQNPPPEYAAEKNKLLLKWTQKSFNQKKMIIIALKACYYIHDEQLSELSAVCGCAQDFLEEKLRSLRDSLYKKAEIRENFIRRRDNAYFFHKKYAIEIQKLENGSPLQEEAYKKYLHHTACWKLKNRMLRNNRYKVCPSNKMIADMIGISERQVSYYIAAAKYGCDSLTDIVKRRGRG